MTMMMIRCLARPHRRKSNPPGGKFKSSSSRGEEGKEEREEVDREEDTARAHLF